MTDIDRPQFSVCKYYRDRTFEYVRRDEFIRDATEQFVRIINTIDARTGALVRVVMTDDDNYVVAEWKYREGMVYPPKLKGMQLYVKTSQSRPNEALENFPASDARRNGGVLPVRPPPR